MRANNRRALRSDPIQIELKPKKNQEPNGISTKTKCIPVTHCWRTDQNHNLLFQNDLKSFFNYARDERTA